MQPRSKYLLLAGLSVLAVVVTFIFPRIGQPLVFHHFADGHSWLGISNYANVLSNLPFLLVGGIGLRLLSRKGGAQRGIVLIYAVLFSGIILVGLGSAYYHFSPDNNRLVWDRAPMTVVFMALLSATVAALVNRRLGVAVLFPLVGVGIISVAWWHYTEGQGRGDLRLYYLVQYYPMLFVPLILWLFYDPAQKFVPRCLGWAVVWYVVAKLLERWDEQVYAILPVSGHTLKHLACAVSTWYFVVLYKKKYLNGTAIDVPSGSR